MSASQHIDELESAISSLEQMCLLASTKDYNLNSLNIHRVRLNMPALEGMSVSREGVVDSISSGLKKLASMVSTFAKDSLDKLESIITFTSFQRERIDSVRNKIKNINSQQKRSVRVKETKYLLYGDKQPVKNTTDYITQFSKAVKTLSEVNSQNKNHITHLIIANTDASKGIEETYLDFFHSLKSMTDVAAKHIDVQTTEKDIRKTFLVSKNMLGMSNIEVKFPNKETYDIQDTSSLYDVHKHFWITMNRNEKIELSMFKDKVNLEMNSAQALEILKLCEDLIGTYEFMMSFKTKLVKMINSAIIDINMVLPTSLVFIFFSSFRLMVRSSYTTRDYLNNCFMYSKGLTDSAISIVENYSK